MRYFFIIGAIIMMIIAILLILNRAGTSGVVSDPPVNSDPGIIGNNDVTTVVSPGPTQGSLSISATNGSLMTIRDFTKTTVGSTPGPGMYLMQGSEQSTEVPYNILFNQNNASFAISLNQKPFTDAQQKASYGFIDLLGITADEACRLNVYVGVTVKDDPTLGGQNLGLSFCQGNE